MLNRYGSKIFCGFYSCKRFQSSTMSLPNYNPYIDPTYLLAVKNTVTIQKVTDSVPTGERIVLKNINIIGLSTLYDESELNNANPQVLGEWNLFLAKYLSGIRKSVGENGAIADFYKIAESFALTGILFASIPTEENIYNFFIIPPYLSTRWASYYNKRILGEKAIASISITSATIPFTNYIQNPDQYIDQIILNKKVIGTEDTVDSYIRGLVSNVAENLNENPFGNLYVGVFAYPLYDAPDENAFLVENIVFYVTKKIYEPMKMGQETKMLAPPTAVTLQSINEIKRGNAEKLKTIATVFDKELLVIYAKPVPQTPVINLSKQYIDSVISTGTTSISDVVRRSQQCVESGGNCEFSAESNAAGFILPNDMDNNGMFGNVDCSRIDPEQIKKLAQKIGFNIQGDKITQETCQTVKNAIKKVVAEKK